jgi:hypothetical protein
LSKTKTDKLKYIFGKLDEPLQEFVLQQLDLLLWAQEKFFRKNTEQQARQKKQEALAAQFIQRLRPFSQVTSNSEQ